MSLLFPEQLNQPISISGSFTGSFSGSINGSITSASFASTASYVEGYVSTSIYNTFTSSYYTDSASFDYRIDNIVVDTGSYNIPPIIVNVATTAVLPRSPFYDNGTNGIGAFLSASISGTLGNIDGVTLTVGDSLLVKNQASQIQNGVYDIISTGSASTYYLLSRSISSDETSELDSQIVIPSFGTTNRGGIFAQTTNNPVIGTDNVVYSLQTNTLISQTSAGTQAIYQIPWYIASTRQLSKGSPNFKYINVTSGTTVTTSSLLLTGSFGISGSLQVTNGITGSLLGTASYWSGSIQDALSSSYASTASYWSGSIPNPTSASYASTASYVNVSRSFGIVINGGGSAITTGIKSDVIIPYNMVITNYTMVADTSGSIAVDLWKTNFNSFPPTLSSSIVGNQIPSIVNDVKKYSSNITNWTSSINSGDIIRFNVSSSSTITKLTLTINGL